MAVDKRSTSIPAVLAALVSLVALFGCAGDEGPAAPELGEEIDLSTYCPSSLDGYDVVYSVTRGKATIEAGVRFQGVETLYELDPITGEQTSVDCDVIEREGEWGNEPDTRVYRSGNYEYAIKAFEADRWGPLYYYVPKRQVAPEENPRINSTFDSGMSTLTTRFTIFDIEYRQVESFRSWTTYVAVEDSVTVPAGTFYNVLKTRVKSRIHTKRTEAVDTTAVVADVTTESTAYVWDAAGIGTIKVTSTSAPSAYEKVLVRATVDGIAYPRKAD